MELGLRVRVWVWVWVRVDLMDRIDCVAHRHALLDHLLPLEHLVG